MNVLVCVKRVPATGGRISLTPDEQAIDARYLGFTISPHEECAVEEAVRLIEVNGGSTTVLSLGSEESIEQLRDAMAMGVGRAVLLETDGAEWDPIATADAIVGWIRGEQAAADAFDLVLFGNEAADSGDYQVGIRVAHALDLPCVTGIKELEVRESTAVARREATDGWEVYEVPLPAVFTVREGINLPRYPSVPGRLKAKQRAIERSAPERRAGGLEKVRLSLPEEQKSTVRILGRGPEAAPEVVNVLREIGVLAS